MDNNKISNIVFGGVDTKDFPDFCDAYIESADYDGLEMNQNELDTINEDGEFVYDKLMEHLY